MDFINLFSNKYSGLKLKGDQYQVFKDELIYGSYLSIPLFLSLFFIRLQKQ